MKCLAPNRLIGKSLKAEMMMRTAHGEDCLSAVSHSVCGEAPYLAVTAVCSCPGCIQCASTRSSGIM